jgi:hypothetical protein
MKVHHLLLLSIFDVFVQASPARSDCGETKTFSTENACGDAYDRSVTAPCPTFFALLKNC